MTSAGGFRVIYADPPWSWQARSRKGEGRSARAHYDTMSLADIKRMFNPDWPAGDCVLLLWQLNSMPLAAHEVITAWGFEYRTVAFTWAKQTLRSGAWHFGLGYWTRQNTERCLLAVRGRPQRLSRSVPELVAAPVTGHSRKPPEIYPLIEALLPGPYLELFSSNSPTPRPGWTFWTGKARSEVRRWPSTSYPDAPADG